LSRMKQCALREMELILKEFSEQVSSAHEQDRLSSYQQLLEALRASTPQHQPNWDEVAALWLDVIRPIRYEKLQGRRTRPLVLRDIRKDILLRETEVGDRIFSKFQSFPMLTPVDRRVSSCIVGVV